jgi:hypothetical protein
MGTGCIPRLSRSRPLSASAPVVIAVSGVCVVRGVHGRYCSAPGQTHSDRQERNALFRKRKGFVGH